MSDMGLRRKHQEDDQTRYIVDLDGCEISNDPTDIRVRLMEPHGPDDSIRVVRLMDKGDIIVLCMDKFEGSDSDAEVFIRSLHTNARSGGYSITKNGKVYIFAPNRINVKKV